MVELNINDSINVIEETINSNVNELTKGRNIDDLSNEELIKLNNMYKSFNDVLSQRLDKNNESIENLKYEIKKLLEKLKNDK